MLHTLYVFNLATCYLVNKFINSTFRFFYVQYCSTHSNKIYTKHKQEARDFKCQILGNLTFNHNQLNKASFSYFKHNFI